MCLGCFTEDMVLLVAGRRGNGGFGTWSDGKDRDPIGDMIESFFSVLVDGGIFLSYKHLLQRNQGFSKS